MSIRTERRSIPAGRCVLTICLLLATGSRGETPAEKPKLVTRWTGSVQTEGDSFWSAPHPRPLLCREDGIVLDGLWDEAITNETADAPPQAFSQKVLIPFSIGSPLSRVSRPAAHEAVWYRRTIVVPPNWDVRQRNVWLNFNSVDGNANVFVNNKEVGRHDGGDAFSIDITSALRPEAAARQDVAIKVSGTFEGRDGIWQTVWLQALAQDHIDRLDVSPDARDGNVRLTALCSGEIATQRVEVTVTDAGAEVGRVSGKPGEPILLPIHDPKCWSPGHPFLYDLRVELHREQHRLDKVTTCLGIRSIRVGNDSAGVPRILLNEKFEFEAGVIDAGRWPDGGSTAPSAPALRRDIEAVKQLGFNAIRKSGKLEPDYWYYRCDRLGLLVWQDVPKVRNDNEAARRHSLLRMVEELGQHAAIVAWVVGGEGMSTEAAARDAKLLKELDPGRLVMAVRDTASAAAVGDVESISLAENTKGAVGKPRVIESFGGMRSYIAGHSQSPADAKSAVAARPTATDEFLNVWENARAAKGVSAAFYREFTDSGSNDDGLVTADRGVIKLDLDMLASASQKTPLSPQIKVALPSSRVNGQGWIVSEKETPRWNRIEGGDFSSWKRVSGPFSCAPAGGEVWARREFTLDVATLADPWLVMKQTGEVEVFINDSHAITWNAAASQTAPTYLTYYLDEGVRQNLREGGNVVSVHWKQNKVDASPFLDIAVVGLVPQHDSRLPKTLSHWPIVNAFFRDTCVCLVGDTYYLTGTTGSWGKEGARIYKSPDMTHWEDLGLVWTPERNATWQSKGRAREKFCMWAPELHFMKGTFWIPYCTSYSEDSKNGTGLLKSTSGKVEGPYVDVSPEGRLTEGLDASLFEDDDGKVYFLHGGGSIARMKDDMSGLAEQSHEMQLEGGGSVGFEGVYLFKREGRYYWSSTGSSFPDHDYDCFAAIADKIEGPYRRRELAISHGGHNMFFQDKKGAWWSTMFGGDNNSPVVQKPGLIEVEFAADGTIHPRQ